MHSNDSVTEQLCLTCGLCCDGTLFKDVELLHGDDPAKLTAFGLPLRRTWTKDSPAANPNSEIRTPKSVSGPGVSSPATMTFPQPCAALGADCRCRIYADRPQRCRQFECALFQAVVAGAVEGAAARRTTSRAREQAGRVRNLLRTLGDTDESLALSQRFKRLKRRLEHDGTDDARAESFAGLSLAVHQLQWLLRQEFYPEPGEEARRTP
jgi:hypothetical protein